MPPIRPKKRRCCNNPMTDIEPPVGSLKVCRNCGDGDELLAERLRECRRRLNQNRLRAIERARFTTRSPILDPFLDRDVTPNLPTAAASLESYNALARNNINETISPAHERDVTSNPPIPAASFRSHKRGALASNNINEAVSPAHKRVRFLAPVFIPDSNINRGKFVTYLPSFLDRSPTWDTASRGPSDDSAAPLSDSSDDYDDCFSEDDGSVFKMSGTNTQVGGNPLQVAKRSAVKTIPIKWRPDGLSLGALPTNSDHDTLSMMSRADAQLGGKSLQDVKRKPIQLVKAQDGKGFKPSPTTAARIPSFRLGTHPNSTLSKNDQGKAGSNEHHTGLGPFSTSKIEKTAMQELAELNLEQKRTFRMVKDIDGMKRYFANAKMRKLANAQWDDFIDATHDNFTYRPFFRMTVHKDGSSTPNDSRKNPLEKNSAFNEVSGSHQSTNIDRSSDKLDTMGVSLSRPLTESPTIYEFHKFMFLPAELRERIYSYALVSDRPIFPHLCTKRSGIKFHDDNNGRGHNTTSQSLAITRVSKIVRQESLPIFYNDNTFAFGTDTPAYFERLTQLGRFHMVHHVSIPINFYSEENGARAMRDIRRNIIEQEKYENSVMDGSWWSFFGMDKKPEEPVVFRTDNLKTFLKHPVYQSGGLSWMGIFFVLRKLSAAYTAPTSDNNHNDDYERELVLRVPNANMFTEYELLRWFPKVAASMGIKLKFVDGGDVDFYGGGFNVEWVQKYQKKDALKDEPINPQDNDKMMKRALDNFPKLNQIPTANTMQYYRVNCESGALDWCKVQRC